VQTLATRVPARCSSVVLPEPDGPSTATQIAARLADTPGPDHVRSRAYADVRPLAESRHELDI